MSGLDEGQEPGRAGRDAIDRALTLYTRGIG